MYIDSTYSLKTNSGSTSSWKKLIPQVPHVFIRISFEWIRFAKIWGLRVAHKNENPPHFPVVLPFASLEFPKSNMFLGL